MRKIILYVAALALVSGMAQAQTRVVQNDVPLKRADDDARAAIRSLAAAGSNAAQALVQEILIVADTTVGTEYFLFTQPGEAGLGGINRSAVRFTPSFDGQIMYVAYFLASGTDNPSGAGVLRVSLAGTHDDGGWITPTAFVDSADVDFSELRDGDLNFLTVSGDADWEVREDEDFFITFEVIPGSDASHVDFIVDAGSADENDDRYFPARTVLYGEYPPPDNGDDGWLYQFQNRNNQVVAVAVANLLAPDLVAPADSSEGLDDDVTLVWNAARRSARYRVQATSDRTFGDIQLEYVTTDTTQVLADLGASTQHWWRVRAENDLGEGPWSRARWFTTSMTTSEERPEGHERLQLDVYPNPTEGLTRIALRLDRTGPVRLLAFDALGRRVEVIYDGTLTRGEHAFEWDAADRPTGALFLRAEVGTRSIIRSLLKP